MYLFALILFQLATSPNLQGAELRRAGVLAGDDTMIDILTIDFPPDLRAWIDYRLAEGRYIDAGEYLRDLIRRDMDGLLGARAAAENDQTKAASTHYASYYGDIRRHLSTEFASETKWLTASLFALNAGGLITLSGLKLCQSSKFIPAYLFWIGILAAFAFVNYSLRKTKQFMATISSLEEQYVLGSVTGKLNEGVITNLESQKGALTTKLSALFSVGSFLAFSGGLLFVGLAQ